MSLKIDGDLESKETTAGTPAIDLEPSKESDDRKWWSELPKTLWNHFKENFPKYFYAGLAGIAGYLWFSFHSLETEMAVSNAKIEIFEKKISETEAAYKERVERELRLGKCRNNVILECHNKCGLNELFRRQNNCELLTK